jgi:hypothetical protein
VTEPLFWLGLSILLVAVCLAAVLVAALPAFQELARAARSAEKLFDTLRRELPPTLEAIRLTGLEISDLTDDISDGVQSAGNVVKQVDRSVSGARKQAREAKVTTRSVFAGVKAAWRAWSQPPDRRRSGRGSGRGTERLPHGERPSLNLRSPYTEDLQVEPELRQKSSSHFDDLDLDPAVEQEQLTHRPPDASSSASSEDSSANVLDD